MRLVRMLILGHSVAWLCCAATLLVLNKDDATVAFVDPSSGQVLSTVAVGEGPHEIVVSDDGKLAFAANYGARTPGSTLSVIDVPGKKELRRVDLSPLRRPHGLAYSGNKVFFTAEYNKLVARYDPATDRLDALIGTGQDGTHMVMISPDAKTMFTANIASNSISIIDILPDHAGWKQTVVPVGKGPEGLDLSRDGRELWTAHSRDGAVSVIDVAGRKVVGQFSVGTKRSNRIKFTPDGRHVLISDLDGGELLVVDTAARSVSKRIPLGKSPEGILIPPAGDVAYVAVAGDNQIAVIDLHSLEVTRRISPGKGPDGMAWIP